MDFTHNLFSLIQFANSNGEYELHTVHTGKTHGMSLIILLLETTLT
jgi:hypothetical protein